MVKYVEVVVPELVLYEESHHRAHGTEEAARVAYGVERQIAHYVGTLIVLPHLVAGGRKECEQNLVLRMNLTQTLHERASLFEFSKRCGVEPDVFRIGIHFLSQRLYGLSLAAPHLPHLFVEDACDGDANEIKIYCNVVHDRIMLKAPPATPLFVCRGSGVQPPSVTVLRCTPLSSRLPRDCRRGRYVTSILR